MKTQPTKKHFVFIPAVIAMFLFSIAGAQDIQPSAIIQIQKSDPGMMKKSLQLSGEDENELTEENRGKNTVAANKFLSSQNNSLSNSISPAQKSAAICPPLVQTNFEGNPLTPFYLPPVGYYASECNVAISNAGKIGIRFTAM